MNDLIDLVLVINLKSRLDRKQHMKSMLKLMGISDKKIVFMEATTRDNESWKAALKEIGYDYNGFLNKSTINQTNSKNKDIYNNIRGRIGNFLSHIRCWTKVGRFSEFKRVLVLEDDICPTKHWYSPNAVKLLEQVENDYQFVYFGDCFRLDDTALSKPVSVKDQTLVRHWAECAHAYLITTTFGKIINSSHDVLFPLKLPSDNWLPSFLMYYRIPFYNFKHQLVIQNRSLYGTDIAVGDETDPAIQMYECYTGHKVHKGYKGHKSTKLKKSKKSKSKK